MDEVTKVISAATGLMFLLLFVGVVVLILVAIFKPPPWLAELATDPDIAAIPGKLAMGHYVGFTTGHQSALQELREIARNNPRSVRAKTWLAQALVESGETAVALEILSNALLDSEDTEERASV